jgi:predicted transcriptional regulator
MPDMGHHVVFPPASRAVARTEGMTLRLPPELDAELRAAAEEDRRSTHQTVILAVETYLAARQTAEVKADPEALRALAEAHQVVRAGDVVYGTEEARKLLGGRRAW